MKKKIQCGKCGDCCEVLIIPYFRDTYLHMESNDPQKIFIDTYLNKISYEEAIKINPFAISVKDRSLNFSYFTCKAFDRIKRLCTIWHTDERIFMCIGYPQYNRSNYQITDERYFYSNRCVYYKEYERIQKNLSWFYNRHGVLQKYVYGIENELLSYNMQKFVEDKIC